MMKGCKFLADKKRLKLGFPFFPDFQLPGKRKFSKKIPRNPGKFPGSRKFLWIRKSRNFRENFPGIFLEPDYFAIFSDFQHFRSNFWQTWFKFFNFFDKLRNNFWSHMHFVLKNLASFKKQFLVSKKKIKICTTAFFMSEWWILVPLKSLLMYKKFPGFPT